MRKFPRFISKQVSRLFSEKALYKIDSPVFLPFYHTVSNKKLPYILNYPYRNSAEFEKELDYFLNYFKPVALDYLIKNLKPKEKVFHLSFDDGLKECSNIIAPVLLRKGIPATFFVNPGFVDNKTLFHRYKASIVLTELTKVPNRKVSGFLASHALNEANILQTGFDKNSILDEAATLLGIDFSDFIKVESPYLKTIEIEELAKQGFTIGAHSQNHPEFYRLTEEQQMAEITESIVWVVKHFNPEIKAFSFPFTDDGISLNLLKKLKSENICNLTFGTAGLKYDECKTHFQRYPVEQAGDFKTNLKAEWVYFKLRKAVGKATVKHESESISTTSTNRSR